MRYERNVLISPRLENDKCHQLKALSHNLKVPNEDELYAILESIEYDQPFLKSITIGTSNEKEMINTAFHLKTIIEYMWYERKKSEVYVNIVIWKNHVGSSKKYVDKFMKYEPDAWIILGSHIGFCNLLKRLYRFESWDANRTYCSNALLSQTMFQIVGEKYFEHIKSINHLGKPIIIEGGKIISRYNAIV
ncbi:hypothetical protein [Mammaliicoccus sciuri]|uniref:hypothetical protein n=1 Tax=Mammaliicoccus sciuri TaxID=1296 RepID=UPI0021D17C8F|nr:hypothetical protein [Mammaliicoccus sciuri]UXV33193.1 hypothetical protein MUA60_05295 [Mammaliicoccus sciuri]